MRWILALPFLLLAAFATPARADEPPARPREPVRIPEMVVDGRAIRPHVVVVTERARPRLDAELKVDRKVLDELEKAVRSDAF